jgi:hypothetical protein
LRVLARFLLLTFSAVLGGSDSADNSDAEDSAGIDVDGIGEVVAVAGTEGRAEGLEGLDSDF